MSRLMLETVQIKALTESLTKALEQISKLMDERDLLFAETLIQAHEIEDLKVDRRNSIHEINTLIDDIWAFHLEAVVNEERIAKLEQALSEALV